ncbi:virulence RhuM family protein [Tissierella pigra]|uniref:Virulence RhuM family protein n=1 Tax=Tissierella pigra TaxID=2607614 RepID=A0A6N7XWK5_9FIRM|nr:virulence RhuM family protein [Tissierella pigra]MSU00180.1 virulence RhuM family protein [Tissierella pigra]
MTNEVIIYNTEDGLTKIELYLKDGTVWLSQLEIAELFQTTKQNISKHIKAILDDGELEEKVAVNYQLITTKHGAIQGKTQSKSVKVYNLDMILAVGYRVRSIRGVQFRRYASTVLKEYLIKGYAMNDERLKNLGGGDYFKELLDRIRDIRSSEKVFYRQVLDLFATSSDYNKNSAEAKLFFATVQNKMHFAIHNHTASELIYSRVDSDKEFMGLTIFKGELPTLKEAKTAKNYLSEAELKGLNQLVSGYLDFAERQADRRVVMTMKDWINHVDSILQAGGEDILKDSGKISHRNMIDKVEVEYKKYKQKTVTQVEKDYLEEIKRIGNMAKVGGNSNDQNR